MQSIGIADKVTLDLIKQDTSGILSNFPINAGFNPKYYDYINLEVTTGTMGQYLTVLDVTGAGFLTKALARHVSGQARVKITIDGVVVAHTRVLNKDAVTGFALEGNLNSYGSSGTGTNQLGARVGEVFKPITGTGDLIKEMPFSDYADGDKEIIATFLQYPLFFNNSCKVEVYFGGTAGYCTVMGGIEI
jgi:hypothetical protein